MLKLLQEMHEQGSMTVLCSTSTRTHYCGDFGSCRVRGIATQIFHTFRHTTATMLFAKGAELPVVMEVLGHSSAKTTMRYSHATKQGMAKALATL